MQTVASGGRALSRGRPPRRNPSPAHSLSVVTSRRSVKWKGRGPPRGRSFSGGSGCCIASFTKNARSGCAAPGDEISTLPILAGVVNRKDRRRSSRGYYISGQLGTSVGNTAQMSTAVKRSSVVAPSPSVSTVTETARKSTCFVPVVMRLADTPVMPAYL